MPLRPGKTPSQRRRTLAPQIATRRALSLLRSLGLGLALSAALPAPAQTTHVDRKAWLADYDQLKQQLEQRYSNLTWFGSPQSMVDLPSLDRRTQEALRLARSEDDARSALLAFVAAFHDGHFSQLVSLAPAAEAAPPEPAKAVVSRDDPAGGCAALGYAISSQTSFSLPFESLPGFHLLSDGASQPFRAGLLSLQGRQLGIVRISSFRPAFFPALCLAAWTGDIWNTDGSLDPSSLRQSVRDGWYASLAEVLQRLRAQGATALLVDVGNNSGGDDSGDIAARLFTALPLHSSPLWMSWSAYASKPYYDEQIDELKHALSLNPTGQAHDLVNASLAEFTQQEHTLAEPACSLHWVWKEQRPWTPGSSSPQPTCSRLLPAGSAGGPLSYLAPGTVSDPRVAKRLHWPALTTPLWGTWAGPLYVLTNGRTYSSAEMFTAVLQNNRAARIVGSKTGGDGCGFMNDPGPVTLSHSRLRFRVPDCVRLRADGTDEVAGIQPDLPVYPREGETDRVQAMRVIVTVLGDHVPSPDAPKIH